MIVCIFTLDYEIYGNGTGRLRELVLEPTRRLAELFGERGAPLVVFPEALELAKIDEAMSDPDTASVSMQLRQLRAAGHEIGLHLHPWWANAQYEGGQWRLDWGERNICRLGVKRIDAIVSRAIDYLRAALGDPEFVPLSFRSGLWTMQPSAGIADVLSAHGVYLDSSVFKGGRTRALGLDYRTVPAEGAPWRFSVDVTRPDPLGRLWEIPIHADLVPFWRMLGGKRLKLHTRVPAGGGGAPLPGRWHDFLRVRYPRKLDFCRMTFEELRKTIETSLRQAPPGDATPRLLVAIGHSKDLLDLYPVGKLLDYLEQVGIQVTTFSRVTATLAR